MIEEEREEEVMMSLKSHKKKKLKDRLMKNSKLCKNKRRETFKKLKEDNMKLLLLKILKKLKNIMRKLK
jgi:hypothetical protein